MTKIMNALQNMDLDNEDFVDIKSFDQSKAILENAIEDLQHYLKMFEKGEYEKFPRVKAEWFNDLYAIILFYLISKIMHIIKIVIWQN